MRLSPSQSSLPSTIPFGQDSSCEQSPKFNEQLLLQVGKPSPSWALAQVVPPRSIPSHASRSSCTPLPHTGSGPGPVVPDVEFDDVEFELEVDSAATVVEVLAAVDEVDVGSASSAAVAALSGKQLESATGASTQPSRWDSHLLQNSSVCRSKQYDSGASWFAQ